MRSETELEDLKTKMWHATRSAVRSTINKFRENPFYFFSESDIHAYFYHRLYRSEYEVSGAAGGLRIYLVHREYPTNFAYKKDELKIPATAKVYGLNSGSGRRGNYDIAVINPLFAANADAESIVNRSIESLRLRKANQDGSENDELLCAVEFKYITTNSRDKIKEVTADSFKLSFGKKAGVIEAVNLVFCNVDYVHKRKLSDTIQNLPLDVSTAVVYSYYDDKKRKVTPELQANERFRRIFASGALP